MRVLITGANGFLGKNMQQHLAERKDVQVNCFNRENTLPNLLKLLDETDFIFHFAGVNRPKELSEFVLGNVSTTEALCEGVAEVAQRTGRKIPILYASSTQASSDSAYGLSKKSAEEVLLKLQYTHGVPVHIFRLPNVFGKWCKPNYNSVVATFCNNLTRNLPIEVNDASAPIVLVYVDDVIGCFIQLMDGADVAPAADRFYTMLPQYKTTVGEIARILQAFKSSRSTLITERVGMGLERSLYATYMSYLLKEDFTYEVPRYADARGVFVEMLKTPDCGQFSFFTSYPGVTRGGHYHHSKIEKFLMIKGVALFRFRHILTGETYELVSKGGGGEVVETVPGWTHDITNVGSEELICAIWANEIFDRMRPDTFNCAL